jgi:hypothetical protein
MAQRTLAFGRAAAGHSLLLDDRDAALLEALEEINHGGKPSMVLLESRQLTEMSAPAGRSSACHIGQIATGRNQSTSRCGLPVRAHLEANGEIVDYPRRTGSPTA